jgi:acyl-ACP thioesterase
MIKKTSSAGSWIIQDNKRDVDNPALIRLFPDTTDTDTSSTSYSKDFLSNGFKIRNTNGNENTSGATYIYMAFAEAPLVGTNNVPANAR